MQNTTVICGTNTTLNVSKDGNYNLYFYANNSLNNLNYLNRSFYVSNSTPAITLDYPLDNQVLGSGTNVYFNFTAEDGNGLDTCELYGNWTGTFESNYTWNLPESNVQNFTQVNLSDGNYIWNVWCNDTIESNGNFTSFNFTVKIDETPPSITLNNIEITIGLQTVYIFPYFTDPNLQSCWFEVRDYDTKEIDGLNNNVTFPCNTRRQVVVSALNKRYALRVYANDSVGNLNNNVLVSFVTLSASPSGGTGTDTKKVSPVIALKQISNVTELSELDRAKLYRILSQVLTTKTFTITQEDLVNIQEELILNGIDISIDELKLWIEAYRNGDLENVDLDEEDIRKWQLIKAILEVIEQPFAISPSKLSPIKFILGNPEKIEFTIESNKNLESVSLTKSELGLSISKSTNTTAIVTYELNYPLEYTFKSVKGTANYVSQEGESVFQTIDIRIVNLWGLYFGIPLWTFILLCMGFIGLAVFFRKNIAKFGKKTFNIKWKRKN